MQKYIVNRDKTNNPGSHHEVHTLTHAEKLGIVNRIDLGYHSDCHSALETAKLYYADADGCKTCCTACHKG